jgi:hypothetical protein
VGVQLTKKTLFQNGLKEGAKTGHPETDRFFRLTQNIAEIVVVDG